MKTKWKCFQTNKTENFVTTIEIYTWVLQAEGKWSQIEGQSYKKWRAQEKIKKWANLNECWLLKIDKINKMISNYSFQFEKNYPSQTPEPYTLGSDGDKHKTDTVGWQSKDIHTPWRHRKDSPMKVTDIYDLWLLWSWQIE